jgi:hypothetical protein
MSNTAPTLELTLRRDGNEYRAAARLSSAVSGVVDLAADALVALDWAALPGDPLASGQALTSALFGDPALRRAYDRARAAADSNGIPLRLRLNLPPELQALPWETLRDPHDGTLLARSERTLLARLLSGDDLTPITVPARPSLCALVAVASPTDLAQQGLAPIDVDGEHSRLAKSLGDVPATLLAEQQRCTLPNLLAALRDGSQLFCLVCHGQAHPDGSIALALEDEQGQTSWLPAAELANRIGVLQRRPLLAVLAACHSAGGYGAELAGLGPLLATQGVPAVLAMQGTIATRTARDLLKHFFGELARDGAVDRALAAARAALSGEDWWQPVLWLRVPDGCIWHEVTAEPPLGGGSRGVDFGSGNQFGNVNIGDVVGRDVIKTDITHGDRISTGNIEGSGIAIGRGARSDVRDVNTGGGDYAEGNIDKRKGNFVSGDQFTMTGDFRGAILNIKSTLNNVSQRIGATAQGDDATKAQLQQLIEQLSAELENVPAEQAKEAEQAADRAEKAVTEALKPEPDKEDVEYSLSRLQKAAENIGKVLPTVLPIATRIADAVRKMMGV